MYDIIMKRKFRVTLDVISPSGKGHIMGLEIWLVRMKSNYPLFSLLPELRKTFTPIGECCYCLSCIAMSRYDSPNFLIRDVRYYDEKEIN